MSDSEATSEKNFSHEDSETPELRAKGDLKYLTSEADTSREIVDMAANEMTVEDYLKECERNDLPSSRKEDERFDELDSDVQRKNEKLKVLDKDGVNDNEDMATNYMTVEDYLKECERSDLPSSRKEDERFDELDSDVQSKDETLNIVEKDSLNGNEDTATNDMTVEDCLKECERSDLPSSRKEDEKFDELDSDVQSKDETLNIVEKNSLNGNEDTATNDMTVEDCLKECERSDLPSSRKEDERFDELDSDVQRKDETLNIVEKDSLNGNEDMATNYMTVEDYLKECERNDLPSSRKEDERFDELDSDVQSQDEKLKVLDKDSVNDNEDMAANDMTVEDCWKECERSDLPSSREEVDSPALSQKDNDTRTSDFNDSSTGLLQTTLKDVEKNNFDHLLHEKSAERCPEDIGNADSESFSIDCATRQADSPFNDSPSSPIADSNDRSRHLDQHFDEDESDYLSVASQRYSSVESLDDGAMKKHSYSGNDFGRSGSRIEGKRGFGIESETDRTDDDYTTCDDRSVVGVNGKAADDDYDDDNEMFDSFRSGAGDNVLRGFRMEGRRSNSPCGTDYYDNNDGYETQEYITADEQSDIDGASERLRSTGEEDRYVDGGEQPVALQYTSADDLAGIEARASELTNDAEEYATADEAVREEEEDRDTVVGSDEEHGEVCDENGDDRDVIDGQRAECRTAEQSGAEDKVELDLANEDLREELGQDSNIGEEENAVVDGEVQEKKVVRRKKSFFSSMMVKKELKIAERLQGLNQRYESAQEGVADANSRYKKARSDLPLMIIERRIPKFELLQRKQEKLEELERKLESYVIYNRTADEYIQNWRTMEGQVHDKKVEVEMHRKKISEKQRILMAGKKKQSFLHSEILRQEEVQLCKKRRIDKLVDRLDMLKIRQMEQRNLAKKRINEAKRYCELSIREAAKVVIASKRVKALRQAEKEFEDKIFIAKKEMKRIKKQRKDKEFEVERTLIQKSVKAMRKKRGWNSSP